jgi:hypothetical protein
MVLHLHPHLFRDLLYRKFAQFLNLIFLHHISFPFFFLAGIPVKYAAVNKHSLGYDKNSKMVKDFTAGINVIFANSNNAELMDFSA